MPPDLPEAASGSTRTCESRALALIGATILGAMLLQRAGLVIGTSYLSLVGPFGLLLAAFGVWRGILSIHRTRLLLFVALLSWMMFGVAVHAALPDRYGAEISWLSLIQFVSVTAFGTLVVARPIDELRFFRMVNAVLLFVAAAGLGQFILQFAGLRLFSFTSFVPERFLLEGPYNTVIPIGDSGYDKSNGMFLVEPSVFSQFMSLALIIEALALRRPVHLATYVVALVVSFSGTGWLMILTFVLTAAFSLGVRGLLISLATVIILLTGLAILSLAFPTGLELFVDRAGEIYQMGSSGHLRFVTPWWLADFVFSRTPWAALYGLGPGMSEHIAMRPVWDYNLNPPVKITLEYGLPAFALYVAFLLAARRTASQNALVAPVFVLLLIDGGYSQFPPVLFPSMILIMMADLVPKAGWRTKPSSDRNGPRTLAAQSGSAG